MVYTILPVSYQGVSQRNFQVEPKLPETLYYGDTFLWWIFPTKETRKPLVLLILFVKTLKEKSTVCRRRNAAALYIMVTLFKHRGLWSSLSCSYQTSTR
jgi:hypothetical protein